MSVHRVPRPYTYREYQLVPEDGRRWELVDGDLLVSPSPTTRHQTVSRRLQFALMEQLERPGIAQVFDAPMDVVLSDTDVVQPDLLVVADPGSVGDKAIVGVPDLVIEILSPSNPERDRYLKKSLYERFGVKEYWVVDPELGSVEAWVPGTDGRYTRRALWHAADTATAAGFPQVGVALADVLRRP
jgi:Uma2 family endonuclease